MPIFLKEKLKKDDGAYLPESTQAEISNFLNDLSEINWLKPYPDLKKEIVEQQIRQVLRGYGFNPNADIEYRKLETKEDYDTAKAEYSQINSNGSYKDWCYTKEHSWGNLHIELCPPHDGIYNGDSFWGGQIPKHRSYRDALSSTEKLAKESILNRTKDLGESIVKNILWDSTKAIGESMLPGVNDYKYHGNPNRQLFELWKMGLYPIGYDMNKFIIYADPIAIDLFDNKNTYSYKPENWIERRAVPELVASVMGVLTFCCLIWAVGVLFEVMTKLN